MFPTKLTPQHFKIAASRIDLQGVPKERASVHYDVVIEGKRYPPKLVLSWAVEALTGKPLDAVDFNAVVAKKYFLSRNYVVVDRRLEAKKAITGEDVENSFPEGKKKYARHRGFERDTAFTRKLKQNRLATTGKLQCDACSFDFYATYGERGIGFIEAHHKNPLASLLVPKPTKASEMALVCSNCHSILHRGFPKLTVEKLHLLIEDNKHSAII